MSFDRQKLRESIAGYSHDQQVLLRLIRKKGGLTEAEFDRLYRGREWRRHKVYARPLQGNTLMLGVGINGFTLWAMTLELLQCMIALDLVDTHRDKSGIVYTINAHSNE